MPEAELHILKARMLEGRMAKARRGELGRAVPMGYTPRGSGEIIRAVKSLPIPTPFSRPIATPHRALVKAYPRHA